MMDSWNCEMRSATCMAFSFSDKSDFAKSRGYNSRYYVSDSAGCQHGSPHTDEFGVFAPFVIQLRVRRRKA
jgi:hypothetical protein